MKKAAAGQFIGVQMITAADGTAFTGAVTCNYTIDGGTQTSGTTVTHEGNGFHTMPVDATISNGDHIGFTFTGTGAIPATVQVYTGFPQTVDNDTKLTTIAADVVNVDGYNLATQIGTAGAGLTNLGASGNDWNTVVPPSVAQFDARTLLAASYFDPATDTVATVTTVTGGATEAKQDTAQADLDIITGASGVNLLTATQASIDAIETDTTTDIPALIATAQADLDIITGASGVNLLTATQASIDAIETDTGTTLPALIDDLAVKKNATFSNFEFLMVLTSDHVTPATGLTVTGQRSIDGAAFTGVSGTIAEVSNGIYQFDAVALDTNGDVITWRFSSATADDCFVTFKTVA